ncbi:NIPSNAP family protein [Salegentibacter sp. JZCK2]|uniref:NIPSNAP family protein n=1 Tax=Salegentibacter tibetensis TaxID=2873600 RepID=UPI001CCB46D3|nr:NIPSNAP family protein [Salegentibacter tibetensis]MBZ9731671.1 NIPSNAP family protein [Salegentibacter tibetensis]
MILRLILIASLFFLTSSYSQSEVYELRVYDMKFATSEDLLHDYFKNALIPTLNRQEVSNVGAFEESGETLPKKVYLLIPYKNMQQYLDVSDGLEDDDQLKSAAETYRNTTPDKIPFERYETRFIRSIWGFPDLVKPADDLDQFELRIYESYNEDALRRKLKMFNEDEFDIFADAGLRTVFFGKNISGDQMPSLTYLLAFKDKEKHQEAWSNFGEHPDWQRISNLEEYANTVSDITRVFLKSLPYSQL